MKYLFGIFSFALFCTAACADTRVFILHSGIQGADAAACLLNGDPCGADAAGAVCRSRGFTQAASYRRVDPDEVTGSVPKTDHCPPNSPCGEHVAIICQR
jgi:hypothetical protein